MNINAIMNRMLAIMNEIVNHMHNWAQEIHNTTWFGAWLDRTYGQRIAAVYCEALVYGGPPLAIVGLLIYFKWVMSLSLKQSHELLGLSLVFLGVCIITSHLLESLRRRGIIRTLIRGLLVLMSIKAATLVVGWMLSQGGSATPELDNLLRLIAKFPDKGILAIKHLYQWCQMAIHDIW